MTKKPGATLSTFTAVPFPPPTPGPPDQPPWEPPPQPPVPSAFSPGNPLVLSAFPSPLLVTGDGGPCPGGAGAGKVIVKVKTEGGPAEPSQTQNFILTQTGLNWIASGTPCGGLEGPPPQFMTASNVKTILPTKAAGVSQEGPPGLPPQAPPPVAQLAPIVPPEKAWTGPHGTTGEGCPAATQSEPSLGDLSYTSKGVYENFRRWQRYKALARRHFSRSPDAEALSCFLIPVLRSLARLKPTMTLEEGLPRAVQEWERTSNFDRMTFYEMAEKFMEFEAEEEMQIQKAQLMNGPQGLSPAASLKLDPPGPLAPEVCQQPVRLGKALPLVLPPSLQRLARGVPNRPPHRRLASKARAPRRRQRKPQRPPVPEAPKEIPPEVVKEYADIMEGLVGSHLATGESDEKQEEEEQQQEEEEMYPDPSLLSYIDELCSQEIFVSKVEAVIHPQFLSDLLSPEQQRDPLALIEELEQEEALTVAQVNLGWSLLILGTQHASSFPEASQGAGSRGTSFAPLLVTTEDTNTLDARDDYGLQVGVSEDTDLSKPKDHVPLQESQESYALETPKSTSYQDLGSTSSIRGTRDALVLRENPSVSETCSSADGDEQLSNFAYLLASKLSLSSKGLSLSPHHASGGRGIQKTSHLLCAEARGLSQPPYPVAKSGKRALVGGPAPVEKTPHSGAQLGVPGEKPLALGVVRPSQPRKRRRDSFVMGRRKKRRRSQ
uniref:Nuclear Testis protein N-terminal domain-containing protein n=1 Tax=Prolemur simus TaxID=1328070 RepID=A0A8C8YVE8_PROSS